MGCWPSRATEASAYGVDAAGRVPDAPSAGRQTPKCSRVPDACPQPDAPHPGGTQSDAPSRAKRHRSLCAPRDDDEESLIRVVERCPPDVSSTSARRIRLSSLAATHPLATPMAPHRPNLARWKERDDPNFTDLALSRSFSNSVATSSFASLSAKALIETETTDETVGDDEMMREDEDVEDDEDEDEQTKYSQTAYREVLAAAAAAVREAVDAVRVAAAPRFDLSGKEKPNHRLSGPLKRLSASTNALNDENDTNEHIENDVRVPSSIPEGAPRSIPVRDETSDATEKAFRRETNEKPTRGAVERIDFLEETLFKDESVYRFVPGVGVTTSRRAPAAAVAKTAMDLARRAGRLEQTRAIRF